MAPVAVVGAAAAGPAVGRDCNSPPRKPSPPNPLSRGQGEGEATGDRLAMLVWVSATSPTGRPREYLERRAVCATHAERGAPRQS